jgi:DNA (cytosine-5)-methyltransferase 1
MKNEKDMKITKVLNLYACLGGNRYEWDEVADIEVTAVEIDPFLAELYQQRFPNDTVIVGDAHKYLLEHFKEFDFIWSSPPCPTHGKLRIAQKNRENFAFKYPDMQLYEEIILLDNFFSGYYCVENVIPYYTPLIQGKKRGRHMYWTNFNLPSDLGARKEGKGIIGSHAKNEVKKLCDFHDFDFYKYNGSQRRDKIARNLVDYRVGKSIFETAANLISQKEVKQIGLFA